MTKGNSHVFVHAICRRIVKKSKLKSILFPANEILTNHTPPKGNSCTPVPSIVDGSFFNGAVQMELFSKTTNKKTV